MALSKLELFRVLSSFSPSRQSLRDAPWDEFCDWSIAQGLAPLAAYNLEYRLGGAGAPQWVRDRLLTVFQGSANDNVMKLVNFKQLVGELQGRRVVLLSAGSFAESLYPHVAFRPVIDLRLFVSRDEVAPFSMFLRSGGFREDASANDDRLGSEAVLTDGRTTLFLHGSLVESRSEDDGLLRRSLPFVVFGPSMRRFDMEDAILIHALLLARAGFAVPLIELVDLRELVLGSPSTGGAYSRACEPELLRRRSEAQRGNRALWSALKIVERLFPQTQSAVERLLPDVAFPVRELLERAVVGPVADVGRTSISRGEDEVRALLLGE